MQIEGGKAKGKGIQGFVLWSACVRHRPAANNLDAASALVLPRRAVAPMGEREKNVRQKRWLIELAQFRACIRAAQFTKNPAPTVLAQDIEDEPVAGAGAQKGHKLLAPQPSIVDTFDQAACGENA